ncbi:hypothetical protein D2A34_26175 [Clostridium chromiireducens]|uniref:SHOCT domain-containing protein n=2 Tax=Clostridium chromiireducens TaxID=225345 RepID=A0A399ILH8_9CLOT|nr:hypothetical protein D2A34_26175 [Clostridium chromiireducens]
MFLPSIILTISIFIYLTSSNNSNTLSYVRIRKTDNALDILNRKFANGEISEDEYLFKKSMLID